MAGEGDEAVAVAGDGQSCLKVGGARFTERDDFGVKPMPSEVCFKEVFQFSRSTRAPGRSCRPLTLEDSMTIALRVMGFVWLVVGALAVGRG